MYAESLRAEERELKFAEHVEELDSTNPAGLVALCDERHPAYSALPSSAIARMRAKLLLALGRKVLPAAALPYVLEELETAHESFLLAAAACSLTAYPEPDARFVPSLRTALRNALAREAPVRLDEFGGPPRDSSPMQELMSAIEWLGPRAALLSLELTAIRDSNSAAPPVLRQIEKILARAPQGESPCCAVLPESIFGRFRSKAGARTQAADVAGVVLEDQAGTRRTYRDWFVGQPSVVVFFYSRCENPLKCPLTVCKLAHVQKLLEERGFGGAVRTAAITYDPVYDTPARLRRYGLNRGLRLDEHCSLLRAPDEMAALERHFALGVSFFESLVSRHRIELFVLDADGRVAASFQRLNWREEDVVAEVTALLHPASPLSPLSPLPALGSVAGVLAALVPKCPVCWMTYLNACGLSGLAVLPSTRMLQVVAGGVLLAQFALVARAIQTQGLKLPFLAMMAGIATVSTRFWLDSWWLAPAGAALMLVASVATVALRER